MEAWVSKEYRQPGPGSRSLTVVTHRDSSIGKVLSQFKIVASPVISGIAGAGVSVSLLSLQVFPVGDPRWLLVAVVSVLVAAGWQWIAYVRPQRNEVRRESRTIVADEDVEKPTGSIVHTEPVFESADVPASFPTMPTIPSTRVCRMAPHQLIEECRHLSSLSAETKRRALEAHIGTLMRHTITVESISLNHERAYVTAKETMESGFFFFLYCTFVDPASLNDLKSSKRGDILTVEGSIESLNECELDLDQCRLVSLRSAAPA